MQRLLQISRRIVIRPTCARRNGRSPLVCALRDRPACLAPQTYRRLGRMSGRSAFTDRARHAPCHTPAPYARSSSRLATANGRESVLRRCICVAMSITSAAAAARRIRRDPRPSTVNGHKCRKRSPLSWSTVSTNVLPVNPARIRLRDGPRGTILRSRRNVRARARAKSGTDQRRWARNPRTIIAASALNTAGATRRP